jgi:hypothetical protein
MGRLANDVDINSSSMVKPAHAHLLRRVLHSLLKPTRGYVIPDGVAALGYSWTQQVR